MNNKQPNVIFIISDQWSLRHADGKSNSAGVQTPGLKRLAEEGIQFRNSYSSFPLCCPARASFFTGLMPHNHQIIDNEEISKIFLGEIPRRNDVTSMGTAFKNAGYKTAYFGKEHAGGYGWDDIDEFGSMKYTGGGMLAEGSAYDQIFTKDAIDYIKRDHNQPFYLTLSLINPHDICKVIGGKVRGATFADAIFFCRDDNEPYLRFQERSGLPANFDAPAIPGMVKEDDYLYEELKELTENDWKRYISTYNLLIEKTDWYIELVLDAIREKGIEEDTIVVFTTDHGDMMGSHRLIAKTNFYEESARTHMLVKYPKTIQAGVVNTEDYVGSIDIMPTLLDMCGVEIPEGIDGKSFKQACTGEKVGAHQEVYSQIPQGRMIRFGNYKYIQSEFSEVGYKILFDLSKDPDETENVYNKEGYEEISKQGEEKLTQWMNEQGIGVTFEYNYNKKVD